MSKGQHDKSSVAGHPTTSAGEREAFEALLKQMPLDEMYHGWAWQFFQAARASHQAPPAAEAPVADAVDRSGTVEWRESALDEHGLVKYQGPLYTHPHPQREEDNKS